VCKRTAALAAEGDAAEHVRVVRRRRFPVAACEYIFIKEAAAE
jgi:hypothetical protein